MKITKMRVAAKDTDGDILAERVFKVIVRLVHDSGAFKFDKHTLSDVWRRLSVRCDDEYRKIAHKILGGT